MFDEPSSRIKHAVNGTSIVRRYEVLVGGDRVF